MPGGFFYFFASVQSPEVGIKTLLLWIWRCSVFLDALQEKFTSKPKIQFCLCAMYKLHTPNFVDPKDGCCCVKNDLWLDKGRIISNFPSPSSHRMPCTLWKDYKTFFFFFNCRRWRVSDSHSLHYIQCTRNWSVIVRGHTVPY